MKKKKNKLHYFYLSFLVLLISGGIYFFCQLPTVKSFWKTVFPNTTGESIDSKLASLDSEATPISETGGSGYSYMTRSDDTCDGGRIFLGTHNNNRGDNIAVLNPGVTKPDDEKPHKYRMWYEGQNGEGQSVFHAYSEDAMTFTKQNNEDPPESICYGTDGRIPPSGHAWHDSTYVSGPWILRNREVLPKGEKEQKGPHAPTLGPHCGGDKEPKEYTAWYNGYDKEAMSGKAAFRIYRALSDDGLYWIKDNWDMNITNCKSGLYPYKPDGPGTSYQYGKLENCRDCINIKNPSVVLDISKICIKKYCVCAEVDRTYHMWYGGYAGNTGGCPVREDEEAWRIYYAHSKNSGRASWEKEGVVLDIGEEGECDDIYVAEPSVILEKKYASTCCGDRCEEKERIYHMWYAGYGGSPEHPDECKKEAWRIFYATSKDGKNWTKKGIAINLGDPGTGDNIYVAGPSVISDTKYGLSGGAGPPFRMWYSGFEGSTWIIYEATSDDGLNWEKVDNSIP